ncbi:uncharacterized protein [Euwallacea fornicatus]|uniref:uncharacterized protein n=1 Tax=Euwallacea fornicatus TaxID=995702 RepID=UPI0033903C0F
MWVYFILVIFVSSIGKTTGECLLEKTPKHPQLSTTFMEGYWYEHIFANKSLQNEPCTHFEITCNASETYCVIYNYKWRGYLLHPIWKGNVTQNKEDVKLVIQKEDDEDLIYDVNLKFDNNALLIWSCNKDDIEFASTLYRMEVDDDMMNVWEQASIDMSFPNIIEQTPAGKWVKIDPRACLNGSIKQTPSWTYILLTLGITVLVRNA